VINILCNSCDVHIHNLDPTRVALPLRFDMFVPVSSNVRLPSGIVTTDTFCPICFGPWLHWDAGTGAMGTYLKVRGADGKPTIIKTAALIKQWQSTKLSPPPPATPAAPASPSKATRSMKRATPKGKPGRKPKTQAIIPAVPPDLIAQVEGIEGENASLKANPDEFSAMKMEQERERNALDRDRQCSSIRPYSGR
jgi:hypothetical protein